MTITTVDWFVKSIIIPELDFKAQMYYISNGVIEDLIHQNKVLVNGEPIKSTYSEIAEGDTVLFDCVSRTLKNNDFLFGWIVGRL